METEIQHLGFVEVEVTRDSRSPHRIAGKAIVAVSNIAAVLPLPEGNRGSALTLIEGRPSKTPWVFRDDSDEGYQGRELWVAEEVGTIRWQIRNARHVDYPVAASHLEEAVQASAGPLRHPIRATKPIRVKRPPLEKP